ncbi:MAG: glycerol-3-phosphate 1-O-acyltransferase PlsY [Dongiaceae bacterium]
MPEVLGGWQYTWPYYAAAVAGYLLGSIPFGLLLTRAAGLGDIRRIGSGNIGATNVLRTGNKALAAATLLLDGGKGAAAVLLAALWGPDMAIMAGGGAMIGHLFPVWLGFRGGKGVATGLGIILALAWPVGLIAAAVWLAAAFLFRYSSLAALLGRAAAPLAACFLADRQKAGFLLILAVLVWLRHHANIRRLIAGTEPRIGRGGAPKEPAPKPAPPGGPDPS